MTRDHTNRLYEACPGLYREHTLPPTKSQMWFGFWCGDGWFDTIWDLSQAIVDHAVPHGLDVVVTQVRERSHALLFRARGGDDTIGALILDAELRSRSTCEDCGFDNRGRAFHLGHDSRCAECGFALWES